jgi:hypothetical protein
METRPKHATAPESVPPVNDAVTRRGFVKGAAAFSLAAAAGAAAQPKPKPVSSRILVGSGTEDGILSFAWDEGTGELPPTAPAPAI